MSGEPAMSCSGGRQMCDPGQRVRVCLSPPADRVLKRGTVDRAWDNR